MSRLTKTLKTPVQNEDAAYEPERLRTFTVFGSRGFSASRRLTARRRGQIPERGVVTL